MVFTIEEIRDYLLSQKSLTLAIENLSERSITDSITDMLSLNYARNDDNLKKYEMKIGLYKLKEEQRTIYSNSNGKKGKYWLACSPIWIDEKMKERLKTGFEIGYWLNYGDNETYGWFSVEEIKQWLTTPELKLKDFEKR